MSRRRRASASVVVSLETRVSHSQSRVTVVRQPVRHPMILNLLSDLPRQPSNKKAKIEADGKEKWRSVVGGAVCGAVTTNKVILFRQEGYSTTRIQVCNPVTTLESALPTAV